MDVYFPVFDGLEDVFVGEGVGEVAVVGGEAAFDFLALVVFEEFRSVKSTSVLFLG